MPGEVIVGTRVPEVQLGFMQDGLIQKVSAGQVFSHSRSVVLGVPGAFTPVCSLQHVPDYIQSASALISAGFDQLICIAPNDPFVVEEWRRMVDPQSRIRFLSDGNLEFCKALGLTMPRRDMFLGHRSERYMLIIADQIIQRLRVEEDIECYTCTRAADAIILA